MFSRLYQSARAIFTDSEKTETTPPAPPTSPSREETMVTTRQRDSQISAGDSLDEEDSINVYVPTSSSKRQRSRPKRTTSSEEDEVEVEAEAEYAPSSSRKRKRLPVRAKDVESPDPGRSRPVVEIPVKKISPEPDHTNTVVREEDVEGEEEVEGHTNEKSWENVAEATDSAMSKKHLRFGSEEVADEFFSTAREVMFNDEGNSKTSEDPRVIQGSDESEDDAPEAVGIQEAAKTAKLKDEEAARAVKDQLSASRKKRKSRDEALKQQAESSKKRKLEDDVETHTKKAKHSAKGDEPLSTKENRNLDEEQNDILAEEGTSRKDASKPLPLSSKRALPDLLPAEYLEDADPEDLLPFDQFPIKKAKKTNFPLIAEKEPKDRRVGSTTYRVSKPSSTNLTPKSSLQARNMKDSWLQGRSGKTIGTNRTSFTKGFFKK